MLAVIGVEMATAVTNIVDDNDRGHDVNISLLVLFLLAIFLQNHRLVPKRSPKLPQNIDYGGKWKRSLPLFQFS